MTRKDRMEGRSGGGLEAEAAFYAAWADMATRWFTDVQPELVCFGLPDGTEIYAFTADDGPLFGETDRKKHE